MLTRSKSIEVKQMSTISAVQNRVVLSSILSFLPLDDLKKARQVNHLWKNEAQKFFLLRGVVEITLDSWRQMFASGQTTSQEFDEHLKISKYHRNFNIATSYSTHPFADMNIFKEMFEKFIQSHGSRIRCLNMLIGLVEETASFNFTFDVFQCVQKLEELKLKSYLWKNNVISVDSCEVLLPFTHLKKFNIELICILKPKESELLHLKTFAKQLIRLTDNVKFLKLPFSAFTDSGRFDLIYLEELVKVQLEWEVTKSIAPMPCKNLSGFTLDLEHAEQLLKLMQPIKVLSFFETNLLKENSPHLQALISKHAQTLESFEINYSIKHNNLSKIDLPDLPKLQSLELGIRFISGGANLLNNVDVFSIYDLLMTGGKKFEKKFPSLRSLTLKNYYHQSLYERILPLPNQNVESVDLCFPQFTKVDLLGEYSENQYHNNMEYNEWMIWLAKLFPNVHNTEFNKARLLNVTPVTG